MKKITVDWVREHLVKWEVDPLPISGNAKLGIVLDVGNSETGSYGKGAMFCRVQSVKEGLIEIEKSRSRLIDVFVKEVNKIHLGIEEGWLIDDGSFQYLIAQVVTGEGDDGLCVPVSGVAIMQDPIQPHYIELYDWADDFEGLFDAEVTGPH